MTDKVPGFCQTCEREVDRSELSWTFDRYGLPWKKVCGGCYEQERSKALEWVFDPTCAGERMEEDY